MPKVSVVVPVYNVERYLEKCVNSLCGQELEDVEIILVDDGSTDGSGNICDRFAEKDDRVVVIHQKNMGLSAARNAGIDIAKGDYIGFVDSDDYVSEKMYSVLYRVIKDNNADISICGRVFVYEDDPKPDAEAFNNTEPEKVIVYDSLGALTEMFKDSIFYVSAWDKLYKRELFDGIRFPVGKIHEDVFTVPLLMDKANTVVYVNRTLYGYMQRKGSILHSGFSEKKFDYLEAFDELFRYFDDSDDVLKHQLYRMCYRKSKYVMDQLCRTKLSKSSFRYFQKYRKYVFRQNKYYKKANLHPQAKKHLRRVKYFGYAYFVRYKYPDSTPKSVLRHIKRNLKYYGS